jgi:hypothetical protein
MSSSFFRALPRFVALPSRPGSPGDEERVLDELGASGASPQAANLDDPPQLAGGAAAPGGETSEVLARSPT